MKAKVIKTEEVVDVYKTATGWASETLDKIRFFEDFELDFNFEDWEKFRREAAKEILPSLIKEASKVYEFESLNKDIWCEQAIEWADELIKQLKEEKK